LLSVEAKSSNYDSRVGLEVFHRKKREKREKGEIKTVSAERSLRKGMKRGKSQHGIIILVIYTCMRLVTKRTEKPPTRTSRFFFYP
jgi:hypothetical protein